MLSTKNYNNNSSIFANAAIINKLECDEAIIDNFYDKIILTLYPVVWLTIIILKQK